MAGISVGSVSVDVVPSARHFARDLRKQILPAASGIGEDIGASIGRRIRESIGDPIADPLADSVRRQRSKAPQQGDEVGGAFAKGFQRRLQRAFASLPKAEIDADSSDADRQIAKLRARLEALSDQTVGVDIDAEAALRRLSEIRAELEALGKDATVDVRADVGTAIAELAAVRGQVDALDGRQIDVGLSRQSVASFSAGQKSAALMRGELVSLVAAATAVAPAAIAGGLGVAAFAATAAPDIVKVISAQQDMAAEWGRLDQRQRVAALSVQALTDEYKVLARSVQAENLAAFNAGLSVTRALLPQLPPLARAAATELVVLANRTEAALQAPAAREFFSFLQQQAGPAVAVFGESAFAATHLVASLTTALTPLAFGTLRTAAAVAELAADLFDAAPVLAELLAVSLALRAPISGLGGFISSTGGRMRGYAAAGKGASLSTRALNLAAGAGPNLYLAAGAALAFFAIKAATAESAADKLTSKLRVQTGATGNNVAGYQALATELQQRYVVAVRASTTQTVQAGYQYKAVSRNAQELADNYAIVRRQATNVTAGEKLLAGQLGITREQANQLATAAGVDLSGGIAGSGRAAVAAQQKISQYQAAVRAARDPTTQVDLALRQASNSALTMKDRVAALKTALDAVFTPSINVYNTVTQLKRGFSELSAAAARAKGNFSGNTAASAALRESFARQLTTVSQLKQAVFEKTKNENAARAAAARHLPVLYAVAGANRNERAQVDALATSLGVVAGRTNISRQAFIRAATAMGYSRDKAEALWREYKKIPGRTDTTSHAHTGAAVAAIAALQRKLDAVPRTLDLRARMDISNALSRLETLRRHARTASKPGGPGGSFAHGGIARFASGGIMRMAAGGNLEAHFAKAPTILYGERETGGEAFIPLAASKRKRSTAILAQVAREFGMRLTPMAGGGIASFANGGFSLSEVLSGWRDQTKPASKSDVTAATTARRRATDQLRDAEAALRKARKSDDDDRIASAERRLRREREELAAATSKLTSVQQRYNIAKQRPTTQLSGALSSSIKTSASYIKNLTTLTDRGFGTFAQQLLAMGGVDAQKIAADAVKLSDAKLKSLQSQVTTAQKQEQTLATLPVVLAAKAAAKAGQTVVADLRAMGITDMGARFADGGIRRMAAGGLDPHIARSPTVLFGEAETGGEAYIPLAPSKRVRSEALLAQVAKLFGGAYVKGAATAARGGIAGASGGGVPDPAAQQVANTHIAAATKRTVELNTAVKGLNATKVVAAAADRTALTTLQSLATSTVRATTTGRTQAAQLARTATASRTAAAATNAAGRASDSARGKTAAMRAELGRAQGQLGRTGQAAVALTSRYHGIPKAVRTAISVNARGQYSIKDIGSFAEGGPVYGVGTATSDSIPARLSNREYVIRAAAHQRYGTGMLDAINEQRFAKGGTVTTGGPVSFTGMPGQVRSGLNNQRDQSIKWTAEYVGREIKKLLAGPLGVVRAAASMIGRGDDRGENNNWLTRKWGMPGAPWCAMFVSEAIRLAKAQRQYPGYPSAAVASYVGAMRHVSRGQPGDLGAYRGSGHINVIASGPRGGGYLTIGGNQGPRVNSYVRGGQSSILRPRGFAMGGPADRQAFRERNLDPADRNDPLVRLYESLRPNQAAQLGDVLNTLNLDTGGYLPPGTSLVDNGTGRPEPVLKPDQLARLTDGGGRSVHIGEHAQITIQDTADADTLTQRADFLARSASF